MALQSAPDQKEVTLTSALDAELSPGVGTSSMEKMQAPGSQCWSQQASHSFAHLGKRPGPCPHLLNYPMATVAGPGALSMRGPGRRPSSAAGNHAQITKHPDGLRCAHLQYGGTTQPSWALGGTNKTVDEEDTRRQESQELKCLGSGVSWPECKS